MEKMNLKVAVRELTGKRVAKDLRKLGLVPGVVYRGGKEALSLQLPLKELEAAIHTKAGTNVLITLSVSGAAKSVKDKTVIVKEIQREPMRNKILHVDFNEISLTETIKVNVPLAAKGESAGAKQEGGVLEHTIWELQIECLPTNIPEKIEHDVSALKIGDAVFVKQIAVPEGVKVLNDPELIVMIVKPPHIEKVVEPGVGEEVAEPELIREKKEKEEEEEKEEGEKKAPAAGGGKEEKK